MGKYRKIKERLDGLERRARDHDDQLRRGDGHHGDHGHHGGHGNHGGHDGGHDEKRIIDTIVRLVAERVGEMLETDDRHGHHDGHGDCGHDHGGHDGHGGRDGHDDWRDEKRMIDYVVDLVGERVQLIVAAELDRRLGPAAGDAADEGESGGRTGGKRRESEER